MAMVGQGFGSPGLLPIRLRNSSSHFHSGIYFKDVLHVMPDPKQSSWLVSSIPSTAACAEPDSRFIYLCFSSSRLRAFTNGRLHFPPLQAAALLFSQTLISPKLSDSTLRMSNANPDIEGSDMLEQCKPSNPSKSKSSLARFKALKPAGVKASLQSTEKRQLKRYVTLAKQLAAEGHMLEFAAFLQMLADAGLDKESFTSKLDFAQVDAGLTLLLSRNKLDTFVSVMKNLTKAGYTAWQFAGKRSREILSDELLLLLETGRTEYCVKIVESLSECGFLTKKLIDSARVIASCAKSWNLSLAYRFVKLLSRKPWHYNLMIREFSYNHQLQSSFDVLDIMREFGVAPDLYTYRALIDSCGRCNESSKAAVVFETMLKDGFKPNVFVYNSLMNVSVGDLDEVQRYYQHMQGAGITGNLASFNILLKAYAACGRADLAADLYFRIQQTGELNLDVVSYNAVINVFGRAKMWEKALRVKADIIEAGVTPNVVTWTSIIEACATAGLVERVFQEFDEMLSAGCCPNVDCYNALLQACVMAGQNERAFQLFQEWKQTGQIRPLSDHLNHPDPLCRTYELIAVSDIFPRPSPSWNGYIDEENWDSLRLSRCKPNLLTYNWMMKACGAAPERIRSLMLEMQAFNLIPDVTSWSILLGAYGSNGDLEGCMDTFKEMRRARFKPDVVAYTTLIKACVLFGESDMAFEIFQEMKAAGVRPNAVTYNTLIRGHRSHSQLFQVQRALAIYEEMREAGHTLNDFTLQGLIKEWGEGLSDGRPSSYVDSEKGFLEYTEALVQKVAAHARDHNDNSIVDLHGLSMGEARAAVLAVLRTIKERFLLGNPVTGDLVINTGVGHHSEDKGVSILRDVVLGVLQEELGLCVESVLADVPGQASSIQLGSSGSSDGSSSHLPRTPVRPHRPVNLGRLKVIKESLNAWLGRKSQTVTDRQ